MFGKKKETIPDPSGMIVNPQNVEPGQIQGFQVIDVDATVPTTGFFEFNSCGKATLAAPFWSFIMDFQRLGTMIYLLIKPGYEFAKSTEWLSWVILHLVLRLVVMYFKTPTIGLVSWKAATGDEGLVTVDFHSKKIKEAGGKMQFAAAANWLLMFLGQAVFFLVAYGDFTIFPTIFVVTILIDIYLHMCEVRAAAFMKNKGQHWRNGCSALFCGIDNQIDPDTVVPLDDPRIQDALSQRNQGGVHPVTV
ncbi:Oidioi.mRNA.OKI2018_I69.chr1.g314.t1.cds [Oikopleura dioica]|uniref:Oidioi.mRNA.OKI2018_I69.chr1.g314.t1.cds n=1 Tax=Oikopleura dioica TaxID=34765 RepID=A0ABN7SJG2_OIKDI|nr:Oidioi.mRNA.OKI2018_I69.chr1.g314.t1.cds [Oikopleura dioica]